MSPSILDMLSQMQQQPQQDAFLSQPVGDPKTISGRVQEWLGAKQPVGNDQISQFLASRQQPTGNDIGQAAVMTLVGQKPVGGQDIADARSTNLLERISKLATAQKTLSGGDLPAALQLANEYQKRIAAGDTQGANVIAQFAKTTDKGIGIDASGNYIPLTGYGPALGNVGYGQKFGEESGKNQSDLEYARPIKTEEGRGTNTTGIAKQALEDVNKQALSSQNITSLIGQARELIGQGVLGNSFTDQAQMAAKNIGFQSANTPTAIRTKSLRDLGNQFVLARGSLGTGVSTADAARYDSAAGDFTTAQSVPQMIQSLNTMEEIANKYINQANRYNQTYQETGQVPAYQSQANPSGTNVKVTGSDVKNYNSLWNGN